MAKTFIPASQLDFNAYKTSLKEFLRSQDRFKDYDFEGSNMSVLLDLLSYNTYNHAHYLNMVGSEMFLDTALLRESIVSHAKELNYLPRSRVSARADVRVELTPPTDVPSVTIPKFYGFKTASATAGQLKFVTDQPIVVKRNANGAYISDTITIYEGQIVTESFIVQPTTTISGVTQYDQRFNLQSENIDISSIEVIVKTDDADLYPKVYSRAYTLYGLSPESNVFFVRGYKANHYEIEFGDGVFGAALVAGNIITVKYRDTIGEEGNGSFAYSKTTSIGNVAAIDISTLTVAEGGSERESNDSIKYNAVRHFTVQERGVIAADYQILVKGAFPEIQQVSVYGGEEVGQYGKVMVVLKPRNISGNVSNTLKQRIVTFLKTKNLVPEPMIVDPEYYFVGVEGNVYYNINATVDREQQIEANISNALLALNDTYLSDFASQIDQSLINKTINESNPAITGSNAKLTMVKRWAPTLGVLETLTFTMDNEVKRSLEGAYTNSDSYGFTSNAFQTIHNDEISTAVIRDNGVGLLHLYIVNTDDRLVKTVQSVGTINYDTGAVILSMDVFSYSSYITFTSTLAENSIKAVRNKFLTLDPVHVALTMIK